MLFKKEFRIIIYLAVMVLVSPLVLLSCNSIKQVSKGTLEIKVLPVTAKVTVIGPNSYHQSFVGNKTLTNLVLGSYVIKAEQEAYIAKNISVSIRSSVVKEFKIVLDKIENHKPEIASFIASPNPVVQNSEVKFRWQISDIDNDDLSCTILPYKQLGSKDAIQIKDCLPQDSYTFTYPEIGNYEAEIWVFDKSNSTAKKTTLVQVTKDNKKPLLIKSFTANPSRGRAPLEVLFEWETDDEDLDSISCKLIMPILGSRTTIRRDNCGGKQNRGKQYNFKGTYIATLEVSNSRGHVIKKEITIVIDEALNPGVLQVTPADNFVSSGKQGERNYLPTEKCYMLKNIGGADIYWEAQENADWLRVHQDGGFLDPNEEEKVCLQIRKSEAATLVVGSYTETVKFINVINHKGDTIRKATLKVE